MQARFYLPQYGRFTSPDPARDQHFEDTQSWNIYSYVQNNPVSNIDPTGMWTGKVHVQLTAILAYAAGYNKASAGELGLATGRPDETSNALDAGIKGAATALFGGPGGAADAIGDYFNAAADHFPSLGALPGKEAAFKESGSVEDFGSMLHLQQDAGNPGHTEGVMHGPRQDRTSKYPDQAMATAEKTFGTLLGATFKDGAVTKDGKPIDFKALIPELKAYMAAGESGKDYEKAKDALWSKVDELRQARDVVAK